MITRTRLRDMNSSQRKRYRHIRRNKLAALGNTDSTDIISLSMMWIENNKPGATNTGIFRTYDEMHDPNARGSLEIHHL